MDNSTAECYVNNGGGTRSKSLSFLAGLISSWCESCGIAIHAGYLPGHLNVIADRESRIKEQVRTAGILRRGEAGQEGKHTPSLPSVFFRRVWPRFAGSKQL